MGRSVFSTKEGRGRGMPNFLNMASWSWSADDDGVLLLAAVACFPLPAAAAEGAPPLRPGGGGIELEVRALQDAPILSLSQLEEPELEACAPYFSTCPTAHTWYCCPTSQGSKPEEFI